MTLQASSKLANIAGSIQKYVKDNLAATFPDAIDYGGGIDFNDANLHEWLQVRMLEPARSDDGIGPRAPKGANDADNPFGREMFHLLNLNLFIRPRKLPVAKRSNLRLLTLRDAVLTHFTPVSSKIEVKDYSGNSESLGYLVVEAIDADRPVPVRDTASEPDLLQHNIVVAFRWTETWT